VWWGMVREYEIDLVCYSWQEDLVCAGADDLEGGCVIIKKIE
jgi:hypothetical protein